MKNLLSICELIHCGPIRMPKDGHLSDVGSHAGPFCHNDDNISVSVVISLVSKSAGSSVGQYLNSAVGSCNCISVDKCW